MIKDMFETMYAEDGVGLAAPQVGVLRNVIVLDTTPRQPEAKPVAMVNPQLLALEGKQVFAEGCLSIPGESEDVERAAVVTVKYLDPDGKEITLRAEGLLSVAIQHECDHLQGVMFVDRLSSLKRDLIKKRMKRYKESLKEDAVAAQAG